MEYIRIAVCFAAGVYLYERISPVFALFFFLSLIMVLTIQAIFKHSLNIKILTAVFAFVLGGVLCSYAASDNTRDLSEYMGRYITLTGRICDIPEQDSENVTYTVKVKYVTYNGETRKINDGLLLTAPDGFSYGDTVVFSGFTETMSGKMNTNGFDYAKYYKSRGVYFRMYAPDAALSENKIRDFTPYAISMSVKSFVTDIISERYTGDYAAIMKAALTGNKREFSDDYDRLLRRTGTKRYFYPAFLHVMLFMSVITFVIGGFKKNIRDCLTIVLLIVYALMNCTGAVFVKLCLVLAVFIAVKNIFGRLYYLDVIGAVALIMGIINPLVYFDSGFAVSMLSGIMIHYFYGTVYERLKFIHWEYLRRSVSVGLICTIGLIPVTLYFWSGVTIYSILISVIMLPCVAALLVISPPLIVFLALFGAAPLFYEVSRALLFIIARIPVIVDKLPYSYMTFPRPDILFLIIYTLFTAAAVKHIKGKTRDRRRLVFAACALCVSFAVSQAARIGSLEITFVNVGQGDGALIQAPYSFNVLIDGGGGTEYSDYDPGEKVYLEYLKAKGVSKVDSAFVSHYHQDHVQGIIAAMRDIKVRNLFLPDNMEGSEWRVKLEETAKENGTAVHYISDRTILKYKNGMELQIIPPAPKTEISDDENDSSYVYYVSYNDFTAAFTGDMSAFAELCLIETGGARDANLLKVSHHGSATATTAEWLDALSPEYAVISVGADNNYGLPKEEVLERLSGVKLYRTDIDGDICFTVDKKHVKINTMNRREKNGG